MGFLFNSPQTTYQVPQIPSYLQNYLQSAAGYLGNQITSPTTYPGPYTADVSPYTSQAITNITQQAQNAYPLARTGFTGIGQTAAGAYLPYANPYVQQIAGALGAQAQQQMALQNQTANQNFAAMGLGNSSPLLNTYAQIAGATIPGEIGQIGGVLSNAYQQERQNQIQAQQQAATLPSQLAQQQLQAGLIPQGTQQNLYNAQYQSFLNQQNQMMNAATTGAQLASVLQQPRAVAYGQPPITGLLSGAANLISAIPGLGTALAGWLGLGGLLNPGVGSGAVTGAQAGATGLDTGIPIVNPYSYSPTPGGDYGTYATTY